MEVFNWFEANWLDVLQSVGFFLTAYAFYRDSVARKIGNMIEMGKQHREVWQPMYDRPELKRVDDPRAALETKPLTNEERRFVGERLWKQSRSPTRSGDSWVKSSFISAPSIRP